MRSNHGRGMRENEGGEVVGVRGSEGRAITVVRVIRRREIKSGEGNWGEECYLGN